MTSNSEDASSGFHSNEEVTTTPRTMVRILGADWSKCGYCKGGRAELVDRPTEASSSTYMILSPELDASWYEGVIGRHWRRSGPAIYVPNNFQTCCPQLAIRLPVNDFQIRKSQRKVLRKLNQLISTSTTSNSRPEKGKNQNQASKKKGMSEKEQQILGSELVAQVKNRIREGLIGILGSRNDLDEFVKWRDIPVSFKLRPLPNENSTPQQGQDQAQAKSEQSLTRSRWLAVSTICAALAGPSKGKIDRGDLVTEIAGILQSCIPSKADPIQSKSDLDSNTLVTNSLVVEHEGVNETLSSPQKKRARGDNKINKELDSISTSFGSLRMETVEAHVASGQLLVHLSLTALQEPEPDPQKKLDSEFAPSDESDPFTMWWQTTFCKKLAPQRSLTVETMDAYSSALYPDVHELYARYQHLVHEDPDPFTDDCSDIDIEVDIEADPFESLRQAKKSDSAFVSWVQKMEDMLRRHHSEKCAKRLYRIFKAVAGFCDFLVANPFTYHTESEATHEPMRSKSWTTCVNHVQQPLPTKSYTNGTYHQHYRLDGELIAVGVLDILPTGLSSVYVFYHPGFSHDWLPMGKYCALQEIDFAKSCSLPYYYMGFYVHSNQKMRYKAEYGPSELLCPTHHKWVDATEAIQILERESPQHHCCTLAVPAESRMQQSQENAEGKFNNRNRPSQRHFDSSVYQEVLLQIPGNVAQPPLVVHVRDLAPAGQDYVRELIVDSFVEATAGPPFSAGCIVNLS